MKKSSKDLLFERMGYVNPDFNKETQPWRSEKWDGWSKNEWTQMYDAKLQAEKAVEEAVSSYEETKDDYPTTLENYLSIWKETVEKELIEVLNKNK